eukprot:TRINITY_DN11239_c0_g2_i1.p2 TRINITY_DN11239_c0_g2~~TRINITY_DN11239_c0_g2_i1.p2  ORF type:complete len:134 (-),score=25.92 TRINITY_DN11239_c0_g2_i1:218-574(-)
MCIRDRINTLLSLISAKPELSFNSEVMDKLNKQFDIELTHLKPSKLVLEAVKEGEKNSTILFVNAYSSQLINHTEVFKSTANMLESLRRGIPSSKVLEKVIHEVENSMQLLLQSKFIL